MSDNFRQEVADIARDISLGLTGVSIGTARICAAAERMAERMPRLATAEDNNDFAFGCNHGANCQYSQCQAHIRKECEK